MRPDAPHVHVDHWHGPDSIAWSPSGDNLDDLVAGVPPETRHRSRTRRGGWVMRKADALALLDIARAQRWHATLTDRKSP